MDMGMNYCETCKHYEMNWCKLCGGDTTRGCRACYWYEEGKQENEGGEAGGELETGCGG